MPRATESFESKVLKFFQSAPHAAAVLLLGLVEGVMKDRKPKGPQKRSPKPPVNHAAPLAPPFAAPKPKKAKGKKKSHKRKPVVSAAEQAEFDGAHLEGDD